jgi:hypothetical protein
LTREAVALLNSDCDQEASVKLAGKPQGSTQNRTTSQATREQGRDTSIRDRQARRASAWG